MTVTVTLSPKRRRMRVRWKCPGCGDAIEYQGPASEESEWASLIHEIAREHECGRGR